MKVIGNLPLHTIYPSAQNSNINNKQTNFSDILKKAIEDVNAHQIVSDQKTEAFARGQITDLHDVMITAQKASITLETAVQIQKKVIDAYNEVMRMQV